MDEISFGKFVAALMTLSLAFHFSMVCGRYFAEYSLEAVECYVQ